MLRSLRAKLVLVMTILIVLMMAVVGAFLINRTARFQLEDFASRMAEAFQREDFVGELRTAADADNGPEALEGLLSAYSGLLGIDTLQRNYFILDARSGACLAGSDDKAGAVLALTPSIMEALTGQIGTSTRIEDDYMDVAVPISGNKNTYIVYIKDTKTSLQRLISEIFSLILQAMLIGMALSIALSLLLSKAITTPLEQLTQEATQMAAGQFTEGLEVVGDDEISVLTSTFNTMASELKHTLEEVGSERDKLGTLFLHMTDGMASFARDGTPMQANPAAERLLGLRFSQITSYGQVLGHLAPLFEVLDVKEPRYLQREYDIGGRNLLVSLAPFGREATEGVMAILHDVTEQRRLNDLRREFVSNVSHELRTPLTNIRSYAETLHTTENLPRETSRSFTQVILNEAERMNRIVRDLLTLSKFDYGKMDWHFAPFRLDEMLRNMYDAMRMEALRQNHTLTLELQTLPLVITGDRERLEQVVANVLSNALAYTPPGGHIELSAGVTGQTAAITVQDNGMGIPQEDLPRLFERFYRVDKARSRQSGGTGLGLAIAREIVEKHQGTIDVDSTVDVGTTVTITLPVEARL